MLAKNVVMAAGGMLYMCNRGALARSHEQKLCDNTASFLQNTSFEYVKVLSELGLEGHMHGARTTALAVPALSLGEVTTNPCAFDPPDDSWVPDSMAAAKFVCKATRRCMFLVIRLLEAAAQLTKGSYLLEMQLEAVLLWAHLGEPPGGADLPQSSAEDWIPTAAGDGPHTAGLRLPATLSSYETCSPLPGRMLAFLLADIRSADLTSGARGGTGGRLRFVEVGVHLAETAATLLAKFPGLQYLGIDPYGGKYNELRVDYGSGRVGDASLFAVAKRRLLRYAGRARLCRRTSLVAGRRGGASACRATWAENRLDLVFLDGAHEFAAVEADLRLWARRVRRGGVVSGHDYRLADAGVVRAVHRAIPPGAQLQLALDGFWWWIQP
eukprot:gnl/TRDRNA2_/TRDRNA2_163627_c0_seq1.p1 gnl/TRDRNA2_/TRDRNA2_163627_c0~~gnl/TRDRNA2_/TRDRNA2_163627_c0_seq1.p1  ORF type:complete len:383 (-),score=42.07 gnl/TRDRNA2_/TRDRNA2_163627_c0_seq1:65-1213(-)